MPVVKTIRYSPRTSLLDVLKLAWYLARRKDRKQLRIAQMIGNCAQSGTDAYHVENSELLEILKP